MIPVVRPFLALAVVLCLARTALAQDSNAAIEQSRLFPRTAPTTSSNVNADGLALPGGETTASDEESFGAQQILKNQQEPPQFTLSGDASVFYTSNVALTRRDTMDDVFFVADAAFSWTPRINSELQLQVGPRASIFRYADTPELDFQSVGAGIGAIWTPPNAWGIALIGRYDFIELIDRHSDELLRDHEFSLAAQKVFVLGRSHALDLGVIGSAGISDPSDQQRDQLGFFVGYHLQLTRSFDSDLSYRHSWYFYNRGGRTDLNQVWALGLHYHLNRWASLDGFISGATNYSNHSAFKYDVFNTGGGLGLTLRF